MNQSEETTVIPSVDSPIPANCHERDPKIKLAYEGLQKLIGHEIAQIDKILANYYDQHKNEYSFVDAKRFLFKWAIFRNAASSTVDVYFKEEYKKDEHSAPQAPVLNARLVADSALPSPGIYTYDEVGAPPSGPTPAKPQP